MCGRDFIAVFEGQRRVVFVDGSERRAVRGALSRVRDAKIVRGFCVERMSERSRVEACGEGAEKMEGVETDMRGSGWWVLGEKAGRRAWVEENRGTVDRRIAKCIVVERIQTPRWWSSR